MDPKAAEALREIATMREQVRTLMDEIRKRQNSLTRIVVEAFNKESAPINGITVESREVVLGNAQCEKSPIGVCAYSDRVVSLPGQRGETPCAKHTDACLFCGVQTA